MDMDRAAAVVHARENLSWRLRLSLTCDEQRWGGTSDAAIPEFPSLFEVDYVIDNSKRFAGN
jgi:hypothetical protein